MSLWAWSYIIGIIAIIVGAMWTGSKIHEVLKLRRQTRQGVKDWRTTITESGSSEHLILGLELEEGEDATRGLDHE